MRARLEAAGERRVAVEVEGPRGRQVLAFTGDQPVWSAAPPNLDFAAVALVQYAASLHCDLLLEGSVTRDLLDNLDEYLAIWQSWRPDLFSHVTLTAEQELNVARPDGRRGAVMGFSGGVDAAFALAAHHTGVLGRQSRQVELGVLVVDRSLREGGPEAVELVSSSARRALATYGADLAVVRSNWQQDFCNAWFMAFNTGYMALLHTFASTHSAAIHATDRSYVDELKVPPYGSMMPINHLLGHPGFPVVSTGGTHNRAERVAFLKDHPALLAGLRVCYQRNAAGRNCGHCEKCVRTQLELRAAGVDASPMFPSAFTLEDVRGMTVKRVAVLVHFNRILERLDVDDEVVPVLRDWLRARTEALDPEAHQLRQRVTRLEQRLAHAWAEAQEAQEEVADLRSSTSWRVTKPLRDASAVLRRRR
jgi:hypothetical protein